LKCEVDFLVLAGEEGGGCIFGAAGNFLDEDIEENVERSLGDGIFGSVDCFGEHVVVVKVLSPDITVDKFKLCWVIRLFNAYGEVGKEVSMILFDFCFNCLL